jgi:hypothetical protein
MVASSRSPDDLPVLTEHKRLAPGAQSFDVQTKRGVSEKVGLFSVLMRSPINLTECRDAVRLTRPWPLSLLAASVKMNVGATPDRVLASPAYLLNRKASA